MSLDTSRIAPQVTLPELLRDAEYKAFFSSKPKISSRHPWRVWIQRDTGKWSFVRFDSYVKAHNHVIALVKNHEMIDGALACLATPTARFAVQRGVKPTRTQSGQVLKERVKGQVVTVTQPRIVKWPMPEFHLWCPYCRRPTRWGYYPNGHRALGKSLVDQGTELRCRICGVRQSFVAAHHGRKA